MRTFLAAAFLVIALGSALIHAQTTAPDAAELTAMLNEFLDGASRNAASAHDKFWAEDLIYTSSSGRRIGKADILKDVQSAPAPKPEDPSTVYTAEDIRIHQYGDTAVVAFQLVGTTKYALNRTDVSKYLNSGTFLKRNGKWQVVNWQATRLPRPEETSKKQVSEVENALHKAMLTGNVKTVGDLLDESFLWTRRAGEQLSRKHLLDDLHSGKLKYSKIDTSNVTVSVYGDTAVVRGTTTRQRSAYPGGAGGDASPFSAVYTLTLVRIDDAWKAVSMHTSRSCEETN